MGVSILIVAPFARENYCTSNIPLPMPFSQYILNVPVWSAINSIILSSAVIFFLTQYQSIITVSIPPTSVRGSPSILIFVPRGTVMVFGTYKPSGVTESCMVRSSVTVVRGKGAGAICLIFVSAISICPGFVSVRHDAITQIITIPITAVQINKCFFIYISFY
jgi:hypothetical protein